MLVYRGLQYTIQNIKIRVEECAIMVSSRNSKLCSCTRFSFTSPCQADLIFAIPGVSLFYSITMLFCEMILAAWASVLSRAHVSLEQSIVTFHKTSSEADGAFLG